MVCSVLIVQCGVFCTNCTVWCVLYYLYSVVCSVLIVQCGVFCIICTVWCVLYYLYSEVSSVLIVQCGVFRTKYTLQCASMSIVNPQDLVLGSSFMLQGSDISLCSVCKTVGKMFVDALVEHLNKVSLLYSHTFVPVA